MKRIFLALLIALSTAALAEESGLRLGIGADWVGRRAANPSVYEWSPAVGLEVGWDFDGWALVADWRHQNNSSSEGAFRIRTDENQILLWGRLVLPAVQRLDFWGQAGAGQRWVNVESSMGTMDSKISATPDFLSGVGLGVGWNFLPEWRLEAIGKMIKPESRLSWESSVALGLSRKL